MTLTVNGRVIGETLVVLDGHDARVAASVLREAGLVARLPLERVPDGPAEVSLSRLSRHLRFELDEEALELRVEAAPELFDHTFISLAGGRPIGIEYTHDTSAFLNYGLRGDLGGRVGLFTELGARVGSALLHTTADLATDKRATRGLTRVIIDDTAGLRRWTLGDQLRSTGELGSGATLLGVGVERTFALDPYLVSSPGLAFEGAATSPSTLEVYVDDTLVRRVPVAPGTFRVDDLPAPRGAGTARYVLRDALGREQRFTRPFYLGHGTLAPGLHEYDYTLGVARQDLGTASFRYDRPVVMGRHRVGLTRAVTLGWRVESAPLDALVNGGPSVALALPFGRVDLGLAASVAGRDAGWAGYLAFDHVAPHLAVSAFALARSEAYATLWTPVAADRTALELGATFTWTGGPVRATLEGRHLVPRDDTPLSTARANIAVTITPGCDLGLGASVGGDAWQALAVLTVTPTRRFSASMTGKVAEDGEEATLIASVPMREETDGGLHASARFGPRARLRAQPQAQGSVGRLLVDLAYDESGLEGSLQVAGALTWIEGGRVHLSRPVQESWAVIEVPDEVEIRAFRENREVAGSDGGEVLIPDLLPYYGNRLALGMADLALDHEVADPERVIAPPFRGGALVRFGVVKTSYVRGRVTWPAPEGVDPAPAFGTLVVATATGPVSSPIGAGGEFELPGLTPGSWDGLVEHTRGRCAVALVVPDDDRAIVSLGLVTCRAVEAAP